MRDEDQPNDSSKHHKGNKATMDQPQEEFIADQSVASTDATEKETDLGHGYEIHPARHAHAENDRAPSAPA